MKENIKLLWTDKIISRLLKISLGIFFAFLALTLWKWQFLPPELPIFFSLPIGTEQLGTPTTLLLLPFLAVTLSLANLILAGFYIQKERIASIILITSSVSVSLLLFISFAKIIFLVS